MFVLGNLLIAISKLVSMILWLLNWLVLGRALISWVNPDPFNPIVQFLNRTTEPILEPIRRLLPMTAIDISPLIAFLFIQVLQWFLVPTIYEMGMRLQ